jgi:hypothetical protein
MAAPMVTLPYGALDDVLECGARMLRKYGEILAIVTGRIRDAVHGAPRVLEVCCAPR